MESLRNRRTIRQYKDLDLSEELLNNLLELSCRASTTGGMQLYSVVVTRSQEMKQRLAPAHFNQRMATQAPVVLTFCADFRRFSAWCTQRKAKPGYNNFQSFMNAAMDTLILTQTFCTLAEDQGLGICYLGTTTYNPDSIIDILSLPRLVFPLTTITVGYPDECPPQTDRLPLSGIVHREQYTDYTPEAIDAIYAPKEALEVNQGFVQQNNKETLAQIFTDIRYTEADNLAISERLMAALRRQGFMG